jgi:hypothetical protein
MKFYIVDLHKNLLEFHLDSVSNLYEQQQIFCK